MLGAVSSLGRAVNEGGKEGFEKALERQKIGIVEKLKQFQERNESVGELLTSQKNKDSVMTVMKEMGKAMEKNVSQIQEQFDSYKKPPPKKKGYVKKVNNDIFRIGFIILTDVRIFSKDLVVGKKARKSDQKSYVPSTLDENGLLISPPRKRDKSETSIWNEQFCNAEGWSLPILLKSTSITSADFCPPTSYKDGRGQPLIGQNIDEILDILMAKMMAEIAKTNSGKVLRIALGDVFEWIDLSKMAPNFQT